MTTSIYRALAGAVATERALDVVAENVANASTPGYRARRVTFEDVLFESSQNSGANVRANTDQVDLTAGPAKSTGNPLHAAIQGEGFFVLESAAGPRLTRNGSFALDSSGTLVGPGGLPALSFEGGTIVAPPDAQEVRIAADGTVSAGETKLGVLWVAQADPAALRPEGDLLRVEVGVPIDTVESPRLAAGALESPNTNVVRGMIDLIHLTRSHEALTKAIETKSELDARTAREA